MKQGKISTKQLREFGFLMGLGLPIVFGWLIPLINGDVFNPWTLWIGLLILPLALLNPKLLLFFYKKWILLGDLLGWINSHFILGIIFFCVLLPISIFMKFFGYDPLKLKSKKIKSFREIKKNHKINLERIF